MQLPSILCFSAAPTRSQGLAARRKQGIPRGEAFLEEVPGFLRERRRSTEGASGCAAAALRLTKVPAVAAGPSRLLLHFFGEGKAKAS